MKLDDAPAEAIGAGIGDGTFRTVSIGAFSEVPGNIWKILVEEGAVVAAGDTLAIIESMKMEISVRSRGRAGHVGAGQAW